MQAARRAERAAEEARMRARVQHAALVSLAQGAVARVKTLLARLARAGAAPAAASAAEPGSESGYPSLSPTAPGGAHLSAEAEQAVGPDAGARAGRGGAPGFLGGEPAEGTPLLEDDEVDWEVQEALRSADDAADAAARAAALAQRGEALRASQNPFTGEAARLAQLAAGEAAAAGAAGAAAAAAARRAGALGEVDAAFGRTGAQSFALEGVLGELQARHSAHDPVWLRGAGAGVASCDLSLPCPSLCAVPEWASHVC